MSIRSIRQHSSTLGSVCLRALWLASVCSNLQSALVQNASFTAELNPDASSSEQLVNHAAPAPPWRYYKGTSEPNAGWDTADERFLGSAWKTGIGGFGYGDGDDATVLSDMKGNYSTVYIRKIFYVSSVIDPKRLKLRMDYDDGFIAYIDGKEFARSNAPGAPGERAAFNGTATAAHDGSSKPGGNPPEIFSADAGFPLLVEGTHVLALQAFNHDIADQSFSLIADLFLDNYFSILSSSSADLSGKAALPDTDRVTVNGQEASIDPSLKTWSKTHPLKPGLNRLVIQSWNASNVILASLTNDIVATTVTTQVGGDLGSDTVWRSATGVIRVTNVVQIPPMGTLSVEEGTTLLFDPGTSLRTAGGAIRILGTSNSPVYLLPSDAHDPWGEISAEGEGSSLEVHFSEMVAGRISITNNATAVLEDSLLRDYDYRQQQIVYAELFCHVAMRRCHVLRYFEMAFGRQTLVEIEDCTSTFAQDDAIKIDDAALGSVVRRCTIGPSNPGDDAIDFGAGSKALVDNCLIHDIFDRGISIGEVSEITVRDSLIYHVFNAVGVKDSSEAILINNTLANSQIGIAVFEKFSGGGASHATATNLIVWGNSTNITLRNPETGGTSGSKIEVGYSDVAGPEVYEGAGNIKADPKFSDPTRGDFRLPADSPALGAGVGGVSMGVGFPVGARLFNESAIVIILQPASQTVPAGSRIRLSVLANGNPAPVYQWLLNMRSLTGATNSTLVITNFAFPNEGLYQVLVSNKVDSVLSPPASVFLDSPLRIGSSGMSRGRFQIQIIGSAGSSHRIEASTNLLQWTPLLTNTTPNGLSEFIDPVADRFNLRFYRVVLSLQ